MINIVSFRDESTAYTDDTRVRRHIFNNSNIVKPAKSFEKILLGDFFLIYPFFSCLLYESVITFHKKVSGILLDFITIGSEGEGIFKSFC